VNYIKEVIEKGIKKVERRVEEPANIGCDPWMDLGL